MPKKLCASYTQKCEWTKKNKKIKFTLLYSKEYNMATLAPLENNSYPLKTNSRIISSSSSFKDQKRNFSFLEEFIFLEAASNK